MSEGYEAWFLLEGARPAGAAIPALHRRLLELGAQQDDDCYLFFHDRGDEEREPEPIADGAEAVRALVDWGTLGGMTYWLLGGNAAVFYDGLAPGQVDCVNLGVLDGVYDRAPDAHHDVVRALHRELGAVRTVLGWALSRPYGFHWQDELERARRGDFAGPARLLDLHD